MKGAGKPGKDKRPKGPGRTAAGERTDELLRESEDKYRFLIDATGTGYVILDDRGRVVDANREYLRLTGRTGMEEILGKPVTDWTATNDLARNAAEVERCLAAGSVRNLEIDYVGPDGAVVPVEINATVLPGPPARIFAVCRDIKERSVAEAALKESEAKFRRLYNETPVLLHSIDRSGALVDVNDYWLATMGYERDEVIGRDVKDFYTAASRRHAREVVQPEFFDTGIAKEVAYQFVKKNGEVIDVLLSATGERDAGGNVVRSRAVVVDVTERRRAEEALRRSEARHRMLYEGTPAMMHSIDAEGRLVSVSDAWLRTLGYTREEVLGRRSTEFLDGRSREYARSVVLPEFMRTGVCTDVPYTFVAKSGVHIATLLSAIAERDETGKFVRSLAVIVDVTERLRAQEALRKNERMLQTIIETGPDCIKLTDRESRVLLMNRAGLAMVGADSIDQVKGRFICDIVAPEHRDEFLALTDKVFGGGSGTIEFRITGLQGRELWLETTAVPLRDEQGEVTALLGVTRDVTERKRAEVALLQSEERFRAITTTASDAILLMDDRGKIVYWNPAAERIFGYAAGEAVGRELHALLAPARMHGDYSQGFSRFVQSGQGPVVNRSVEMIAVRKGGAEFPIEVSTSAMNIEGRWHALGIVRDVTERKRAEEEARRSEARMASLYRISQRPVGNELEFLDFALNEAIALTGSAIGYLYFYDEARREFDLNSYSRDVMKECSIPGRKSCYELDRTGVWGEAVRQRTPILMNDFEAEHPLKKGYPEGHARLRKFLTVPVIMQGAVVAVVGVANKQADYTEADVTQLNLLMDSVWKMIQRSRAERALQESEQRFRDLAESLPLTIFEVDLQGRFTYANRAALEKFGYTAQDLAAGLSMSQVVAAADRARAQAIMDRRLAGVEVGYNEYLGLRKDGGTFPMTVASNPILRDGHPVGLRGFALDLTERKQLEAERMKADKLESIGALAGGIAHDFNNLLQGVFGYISLAKLEINDREKALASLEQTEKALHNSVGLAAQLLTFSKGGKPVKRLIDLRPVVENACRFSLSGSRTSCRLALDDGLWSVEADEGQVAQVIQNIVLNADQAMPQGGTVEVSAQNVPPGDPGVPAGLPPSRYVKLSITDSGIGIPAEYQAKIFDPYFTTKEKGSGLGLATSYSIARNHGGLITVRSRQGEGSTFDVYLPASGEQALEARATAASTPHRRASVLVMDDDAVVLAVAGELLRALGHEAVLTAHGEQAVERYREAMAAGRPFDAVILDLTVRGGLGGQEAVLRIREIDPGVKAVVSSGYSEDAVTSHYREHGFQAFLSKPYTAARLNEVLNALLA